MEPTLGEIRLFAGNFAPRGWALCQGQLLAISSNDELFSLLGTIYGGDGRTTFGLPDFRGRVPVHQGTGPGLSPYRIGSKGGVEQVTLNVNEIPSHNHLPQANTTVGGSPNPTNGFFGASNEDIFASTSDVNMGDTLPNGGNLPHPNHMPFLAMNYIICIAGLYPSRT